MKVTDLMVGDWVNIKGKSVKVTLDDLRTMLILFEDVDFHIDPIPLTEDILVKNGFDFTKRDYGVCCEEDKYGDVELSKDKNGFYLSINTDEYEILRINYVHTLQHLLRLCGVEKELTI